MCAVHIGVGHDNHFVVADFLDIKIIAANTCAQRRNHRADFLGAQHSVKPGALDVQDFTLQRQYRLILTIARLFGRASRRIPLHEEEFGFGRVALLTIRELAGERSNIQCGFTARQITGFARRFAGGGGFGNLLNDELGFRRMLFKPFAERFIHRAFDNGPNFGRHQLVFGLGTEFRVRYFYGQHTS